MDDDHTISVEEVVEYLALDISCEECKTKLGMEK